MSCYSRLWFLPLVVSASISPTIEAQNRLARAPLYSLGTGTTSAVTTDFNSDGHTDMVAFQQSIPISPSTTVTVTLAKFTVAMGHRR